MRKTAFVLLCAAGFAAAEPGKGELAELVKQRKIAMFFDALEERGDLDPAAKAQAMALREGATLGGEYGCIHQSLLILSPEYKRADALLLHERYAAAAEAFDALRASEDPYLAAYALYRYGLAEFHRERYEKAAEAFLSVLNEHRRAGCDVDAAFYLAVAYGQSREKEKALVAAKTFLDDYPDAPQRYRLAMEQMTNELLQDWESPLYDLSSRMDEVARRIEDGDTADKTQEKQKEIVDILNELIQRAEQNEGQGQGQGGGGGGNPRGNDPSSSPANRSSVSPGQSRTGELRGGMDRTPGETWGAMRDKEREEVLQSLEENLPGRYRKLAEDYHRALAEGRRPWENEDGEE